jgi:hypothetical protein
MSIFNIEQKENTPEMLANADGKPTKNFQFAEEFNSLVDASIQSKLDNVKIDFYWSDKPDSFLLNIGFIEKIQKLKFRISDLDFFKANSSVSILIERYRKKRQKRTIVRLNPNPNFPALNQWSTSGFRSQLDNEVAVNGRPTELPILSTTKVLDIAQEKYFAFDNSRIRATGMGRQNRIGNRASVYLQFRLKVIKNDKIYISKPLQTLQMICKYDNAQNINPSTPIRISYKLK